MAEADNYWDDARKLWIDGATGNYMKPADQGGDGLWYSADGAQKLVNGQWMPAAANVVISSTSVNGVNGVNGGTAAQNGNLQLNPGYQYDIQSRDHAFEADQQRINNEFQSQQNALNRQMQQQLANQDLALRERLQNGEIDANKYMQARSLAQQESEFARSLAQRTLEADRDFQLSAATEAREERLLRAQLAANPQDTVAYEFYKRGMGGTETWDLAQQFANGGNPQGAQAGATTAGVGAQATQEAAAAGLDTTGASYQPDNPAYSDQTMQQLLAAFYGGNNDGQGTPGAPGQGALYNPRLSGSGVFGSQIQSPGAISRRAGSRMTNNEMGVLSSFLRGGIDVGGGKRVSIDPAEYFQQVEDSWIPTASSVGQGTQYR